MEVWLIPRLSFFSVCIQYHTDGNRVVFYIDDSTTANALVKVSRKITGKDGYKVCIFKYAQVSSV